jgi:hypothetical protein
MTKNMALSEDAVTVVALGGTALAYAASIDEEVERWLRALRLYGAAGIALQAVGVDEEPRGVEGLSNGTNGQSDARVAAVLTSAEEFATQRGAPVVGTTDLVLAAMRVYGDSFDRALAARGTDRVELVERLETDSPVAATG